MENYLYNRLYADAAAVIEKSKHQDLIVHQGLKGRIREILVADLLRPWLPPVCVCGTGTIISGRTDEFRKFTQDDIIIYDKSITPPILAGTGSDEGVFLYNGVLCRIEVKSKLRSRDIRNFVNASVGLASLKQQATFEQKLPPMFGAMNMIIAFSSNLKLGPKNEFQRFNSVMEKTVGYNVGKVSNICVIGQGFWSLFENGSKIVTWHKLASDDPVDHLLHFVSLVSGTVFRQHQIRNGYDWKASVASGISLYLNPEWEEVT